MTTTKYFTVDQAEKTLPLVERIVKDIVDAFSDRAKKIEERRLLGRPLKPGSKAEERALRLEQKIRQQDKNLLRYQNELTDLGVELKDNQLGLIDYHSRFEDRVVYLCWKLGEGKTIRYYHDLDSGFKGRKAINASNRDKFHGQPAEARRI